MPSLVEALLKTQQRIFHIAGERLAERGTARGRCGPGAPRHANATATAQARRPPLPLALGREAAQGVRTPDLALGRRRSFFFEIVRSFFLKSSSTLPLSTCRCHTDRRPELEAKPRFRQQFHPLRLSSRGGFLHVCFSAVGTKRVHG